MNPTYTLGPVGSQGYGITGSGMSSTAETWVVVALFGGALLAALFFGFVGAKLDGGASASIGA